MLPEHRDDAGRTFAPVESIKGDIGFEEEGIQFGFGRH